MANEFKKELMRENCYIYPTSLATLTHKWANEESEAILLVDVPEKETKYFSDIADLEVPLHCRQKLTEKQIVELENSHLFAAQKVDFGNLPKGYYAKAFVVRDVKTDMLMTIHMFNDFEFGNGKDYIPLPTTEYRELTVMGLVQFLKSDMRLNFITQEKRKQLLKEGKLVVV